MMTNGKKPVAFVLEVLDDRPATHEIAWMDEGGGTFIEARGGDPEDTRAEFLAQGAFQVARNATPGDVLAAVTEKQKDRMVTASLTILVQDELRKLYRAGLIPALPKDMKAEDEAADSHAWEKSIT